MIKEIVRAIVPRPVRHAIWRAQTATGCVSAGAVRRVLVSNERLFLWTYNHVSRPPRPSRARVPCRFQHAEEQQIEAIVSELRKNGMAIWRGLFAEPVFLREAQSTLDEDFSRWEKIFRERDDSCEEFLEEESRCRFYRGTKKNFEIDRRTRVCYCHDHMPHPIQKMKGDARLREVVCRYYQLDAGECHYILAEKLSPSPVGDSWHIDRIKDQFKVMILLSDVGPEHGAMRYKLGTHQKPPPKVDHFFYQYFRAGIDYAYVPPPLAEQAPGEDTLALGRAGDCIFFDTTGLHSGTRCQTEERVAVVLGFTDIPSLRNRVLTPLSGGKHM